MFLLYTQWLLKQKKKFEGEGECFNINDTFGRRFGIKDCEIDENGKMILLDIISNNNILTQEDIDIISGYNYLQELEFTRFGNITDVNMESLHVPKIIFYDLKKILHSKQSKFRNNVFTPEVLKTIKNVESLELSGYKITQSTLDSLSTLTNVKEITLLDSGFDVNLDFSVLKNAKKLTTLILHYYEQSKLPLEGFSDSICKIKQLKRLDIDCEITSIPSCISNLKKLEHLDLYYNEISEIPDEIGDLSRLKYLNLKSNNISKFNSFICNLSKLENLNIGSNSMEEIPSCIQNLSKLKNLDISSNGIKTLPRSFYNLKKLENLDIGFNEISKLSSSIKNFKNLKSIEAYYNNISVLPNSFLKLVNLEIMKFGLNNFTVIPDDIRKLVNLKEISFENNKISVIPEAIGKLSNLEHLNLYNNKITDLPEFLGNLTKLQILNLGYNDIDATIPESYNNIETLTEIRLDGNENIYGKTLTNPNLHMCYYTYREGNDLCKYINSACTVYPIDIPKC